MPEKATHYNPFPPAYVCQQFRGNHPVSTDMIYACFDPEKTRYNHTSARTCAHFVVATSFVLPLLRALSVTPRVSCCDDGRTSWRAMRRPNQSWLFCSARLLSRSWTSSLQIPSPFVGQLTKIATVHVTRVPRTRFVVGRYM